MVLSPLLVNADNVTVSDAGDMTIRGGLTLLSNGMRLGGSLTFATVVSQIVPGTTSIAFRNAANNANNLFIADSGQVTIRDGIVVQNAGIVITAGNFTIPGAAVAMITTTTTITSGAASGAGTLANAPSAGNPTKWIPINDAGTTRYIPAW